MSLARAPQTAFVVVLLCAVHGAEAQPGPATPNPKLGASCSNDDDCGAGLLCLTVGPAATEGVPPDGLCTASCSADPTICEAIAPGAGCTHLALGGSLAGEYCLEGCVLGQGNPDKCHGRPGFACSEDIETTQVCDPFLGQECSSIPSPNTPGSGSYCSTACEPAFEDAGDSCEAHCFRPLCLPTCTRDRDCQADLSCNPATGLCDATGRQGGAPGANCGAGLPACAGSCRFSSCAETCVVGQVCGPPDATNARCFDAAGAAVGDRGRCRILCNCAADCRDLGDDWACVANPFAAIFGFRGECQEQFGSAPDAGIMIDEEACEPPPASCLFGGTIACRTDEGCLGVAECEPDGSYSGCVCHDAGVEPPVTLRPDAAVSMDASTPDAGGTTVRRDAGPRDGGDDGGPPEKDYDTDYGGICSLAQVTHRSSSRHVIWLVLVAAVLRTRVRVARRARAHRRRPAA